MTLTHSIPTPSPRAARRYLRPPVPIHFPIGEDVPESGLHKLQLMLLFQAVEGALGERALLSSDQFLYWDPTDPKKCLAPDLAVRMNTQSEVLETWKTWEHGAPHVGVEIVSGWDRAAAPLAKQLERYRQAGIAEVVRFDRESAGQPIRLWDLVDGDLVERELSSPEARLCDALGLYWCIRRHERLGPMLWLARDPKGEDLLSTPLEEEQAAKEAALNAKDAAVAAKDAAVARIAELEAELARRR